MALLWVGAAALLVGWMLLFDEGLGLHWVAAIVLAIVVAGHFGIRDRLERR